MEELYGSHSYLYGETLGFTLGENIIGCGTAVQTSLLNLAVNVSGHICPGAASVNGKSGRSSAITMGKQSDCVTIVEKHYGTTLLLSIVEEAIADQDVPLMILWRGRLAATMEARWLYYAGTLEGLLVNYRGTLIEARGEENLTAWANFDPRAEERFLRFRPF